VICITCQAKTDHTYGGQCDECAPDDPVYGPSHRCKLCGKKEHCTWEPKTQKRLRANQTCFICDFWQKIILQVAVKPDESVRVKGHHYFILPDLPDNVDKWHAGHGGSLFRIQFNDGRYVESRNVWHQGDVPAHFADQLPDNATFLPITLEFLEAKKKEKK
jgi:hypothetical protein